MVHPLFSGFFVSTLGNCYKYKTTAKGLIHHSDRGSQYCSQNYVSILKSHGSQISMTQTGDPLENAIAERANGILKTEWLYRMTIPTRKGKRLRVYTLHNSKKAVTAD